MTHVIVWSHSLHHDTVKKLEELYGDITVHTLHYHNENRHNIEDEVNDLLNELKALEVLQGRVVVALPALSIATFLVTVGIFRDTGIFPDVINLLQCNDGRYRPSSKSPVIRGQQFGDRRRRMRAL